MSKIFICHANTDKKKFVQRLAEDLRASDHFVWFDDWSIKPGESLAEKIETGIETCDFFVIVISRRSINSKWVKLELNNAIIKELEDHTTIIPIVIGSIRENEIPLNLRSKYYLDFRRLTPNKYDKKRRELLESIRHPRHDETVDSHTFECPRFLIEDTQIGSDFHLSTTEIVCIENELERQWVYDRHTNTAALFFRKAGQISRKAIFKLDHFERAHINTGNIICEGWYLFSRTEGNRILKLQYEIHNQKTLSFYWINYAIEQYLEVIAREFARDWDIEVTLKSNKPK